MPFQIFADNLNSNFKGFFSMSKVPKRHYSIGIFIIIVISFEKQWYIHAMATICFVL